MRDEHKILTLTHTLLTVLTCLTHSPHNSLQPHWVHIFTQNQYNTGIQYYFAAMSSNRSDPPLAQQTRITQWVVNRLGFTGTLSGLCSRPCNWNSNIYNWNSNFVVNLFSESHRKTDVCVTSIIFQWKPAHSMADSQHLEFFKSIITQLISLKYTLYTYYVSIGAYCIIVCTMWFLRAIFAPDHSVQMMCGATDIHWHVVTWKDMTWRMRRAWHHDFMASFFHSFAVSSASTHACNNSMSCHVMLFPISCHVVFISCHALSCHAISRHAISCHTISCHVIGLKWTSLFWTPMTSHTTFPRT